MGDEVTAAKNRAAQVRRQRSDGLTAVKRQRFLDMLAATANVQRSAEAAGASSRAFALLRRRDEGFATAWTQALHDSYATLEARLVATALGTTEQLVGDAGAVEEQPFDPKLAIEVLRRRDAAMQGPRVRSRVAGYKNVPIADVERSLIAKLEALERRMVASGAIERAPDATA